MNKELFYSDEARQLLKKGIDAVANSVKVTLGPKGRHVVLEKNGQPPHITKDGVSVANEIYLKDPVENIGAQMIKEASTKTADIAGDGTTTATVLAQAIVTAGLKNVASGANPIDLKRGIDKAVSAVVSNLKENSTPISLDDDRAKQVASISANNDTEMGEIIAGAVKMCGVDGVVTVEASNTTETFVKKVDGMRIDRGYISPYFSTNPSSMEAELIDPFILITDKKISQISDLIPVLEKAHKAGRPMLIIADDVDGEALATLVVNKVQRGLKVAAIKMPGFGEDKILQAQDLAVLVGAKIVSDSTGVSITSVSESELGVAEKVTIGKDFTLIVGGKGDKDSIETRIEELRSQVAKDANRKTKERLAKLSGGIAVICVGAHTELEMKERMDRVDDALHATVSAIQEGIVAGGGVALIRSGDALDGLIGANEDENTGIKIVKRAIEEPLRQIVANAGGEGAVIVQKVREGNGDYGYNARTETFENLFDAGVIDPTKVVRVALENAASVSGMILTTECVISNEVK